MLKSSACIAAAYIKMLCVNWAGSIKKALTNSVSLGMMPCRLSAVRPDRRMATQARGMARRDGTTTSSAVSVSGRNDEWYRPMGMTMRTGRSPRPWVPSFCRWTLVEGIWAAKVRWGLRSVAPPDFAAGANMQKRRGRAGEGPRRPSAPPFPRLVLVQEVGCVECSPRCACRIA